MRRLITALLAFFLPALACLTVRAVEELPSWAIKAFNEKLSARYELFQKTEPSFFAGDFNGDGRSDVALLIQERTTGKVGIAILESGKNQFKILGAGKSFGNGGDDFSWMDVWSIRHSGKADQLYVGKREAASAVNINGNKRATKGQTSMRSRFRRSVSSDLRSSVFQLFRMPLTELFSVSSVF